MSGIDGNGLFLAGASADISVSVMDVDFARVTCPGKRVVFNFNVLGFGRTHLDQFVCARVCFLLLALRLVAGFQLFSAIHQVVKAGEERFAKAGDLRRTKSII